MQQKIDHKDRFARTFRDIARKSGESHAEQEVDWMSWGFPYRGSGITWADLLQSRRVLIVAEAGVGKTYECRTERDERWSKGEPAYFFELSELASNPPESLLQAEELDRLNAWRTSQADIATFFLDSIDELKLTRGSFETALRKLGNLISGQLGRSRIVVTTRPIPFDVDLVKRILPLPEIQEFEGTQEEFADIAMRRRERRERTERLVDWRHVELTSLTEAQIKLMISRQGITDADALLTDIKSRNAQDFARRPQDLIELCSDWRSHRRIRTHLEQVQSNVSVKLQSRSDARNERPLADEMALNGASRIALALLLSRRLTIRHSAESDRGDPSDVALDPVDILPTWTAEHRAALLQRPIFGFASYGRVRFHHRSVVEYLAAYRIDRLILAGMPLRAAKRLLFSKTDQDLKIVKPSMRPLAAWLSLWHPSIFDEVCAREPEVLLQYGDPESIRIDLRILVLRAYANQYGRGNWRGTRIPPVQVTRFASDDLQTSVEELWGAGIENPEVCELLLEMIAAAPSKRGVEVSMAVLSDPERSLGERLQALDALIKADDQRLVDWFAALKPSDRAWNERFVRNSIPRIFPRHITPASLTYLLEKLVVSTRTVEMLGHALTSLIEDENVEPEYLDDLRGRLASAALSNVEWQATWPHLKSNRADLLEYLAAICLVRISQGPATEELVDCAVFTLRLSRHDHGHVEQDSFAKLRRLLEESTAALRQRVFWSDCDTVQWLHAETDPWKRFIESHHHGAIRLARSRDWDWVQGFIASSSNALEKRAVSLEAAMYMRPEDTTLDAYAADLKLLVQDSPALGLILDQWLAPKPINEEMRALEEEHQSNVERDGKRNRVAHASWVAFWREISENPDAAFGPDKSGNTAWNLWKAMQRSGDESRASGWNRRFIEAFFGTAIADRLRITLSAAWRRDRPTLRSERPDDQRDTFLTRWQFGFAGITAEAEDKHWAEKITSDEAELAARYAPLALGNLPTWIEDLSESHSEAVEKILGREVDAELLNAATPNSSWFLLQCIGYAPSKVARLFLPRIEKWLESNCGAVRAGDDVGAATRRLGQAAAVIAKHGGVQETSRLLAISERCLSEGLAAPFADVWLPVLMQSKPEQAIVHLKSLLANSGDEAKDIAAKWLAALFSDRSPEATCDLRRVEFTPTILLTLTRMAFTYVPPAEDIPHQGSFTPRLRDDAERARSNVLNALLACAGQDGWDAKIAISNDALFINFRDRARALARESAAEEVDHGTYAPKKFVDLDQFFDPAPLTRQDMSALLADRLADLEDFLLRDDSPRAAWLPIGDEHVMRREIARFLRENSRRAYVVDQESVTVDEKETDIRLRSSASDHQGVIELKLGDGRSGRDLFDTLRGQLLKKYMAPENSRSGCLLVTVGTNKRWEHPTSGELLDVEGLKRLLTQEAAEISWEMRGELDIFAWVVDLRPRLATESRGST